jgi:site-specific DNA-methyltransferase (adenine-specific)
LTEHPQPNTIIEDDCLDVMPAWPDACVDHCIADPPFGIASGSGRRGKKGLGWAFSSHVTMQETWDRFSHDEFFQFNVRWLSEVCRVVKPNGNILVFGTFHNIYQLGFILQSVLNRRILNSIVWFKPNAQPNITARTLTESTEQIIWAVNETPKRARDWVFNYWKAKGIANGRQMRNLWAPSRDLWEVPVVPARETRLGKHPAQKPLDLTNRLVAVATEPGNLILDPFAGAGGVALSAMRYRRPYVLIECDPKYVAIAHRRIQEFRDSRYMRLLEASSFTPEDITVLTEVPVPQADNLDKVLQVPGMVIEGFDTRSKIARNMGYSDRQGPYYADAAMALRLVETTTSLGRGAQHLAVTQLGHELCSSTEADRVDLKKRIVLGCPIVRYVSSEIGVTKNGESPVYPVHTSLLDATAVAPVLEPFDLAPNTAQRRARTLCDWLSEL